MLGLNECFSLETVLDTLPHPVVLKTSNTVVCFVNHAYERLYGVDRNDIIGKKISELAYLSDQEKRYFQERDGRVLRTGRQIHKMFDLERNGARHHLLYWTGPIELRDGQPGLIGIIVNITAQKRIETDLKNRFKKIQMENMRLEDKSNKDFLTGLYNRRFLNRSLETLVNMASAGGASFSCLMIDVDNFKQVNDTYGHYVGDTVLQELADVLRSVCRECDITGRYGGDEFMVLLPGTPAGRARPMATRLCAEMESRLPVPCGSCITLSIGVSEYVFGDSATDMIKRADSALYTAKATGRNRVCSESL